MKEIAGIIFIFLMSVSMTTSAVDKPTDTFLINKLESILKMMELGDERKTSIAVRLADIYSERARLEEEEAMGENPEILGKAKEDRAHALFYYQNVFASIKKEERGRVLFQMAQLQLLNGDSEKARETYGIATKDLEHKFSPQVVGEALTKLGDLDFNQLKYNEASKEFNGALAIADTPKREYIRYRVAWCLFHQGQISQAKDLLRNILSSPEVVNGPQNFREEMTRDYLTFISREEVTEKDFIEISKVIPPGNRQEDFIFLASELDRLGKKTSALVVLNHLVNETPVGREEERLRMAQLYYDLRDLGKAQNEIQIILASIREKGLPQNSSIKRSLEKILVTWARAEESPSPSLIVVYDDYNTTFKDYDMVTRGALVNRKAQRWSQSLKLYRHAIEMAQENPLLEKNIEELALNGVEVAELSKNPQFRDSSYRLYLDLIPEGVKAPEIRYQMARLAYENHNYQKACREFQLVSVLSRANLDLRIKAADLNLDSLALLKDNDQIEKWAIQYSNLFEGRRDTFLNIAKKAVIKEVASTIDDEKSSPERLRAAMKKLDLFNYADLSIVDQIGFDRDKLIISERLRDLGRTKILALHLLSLPGLSAEDKVYALSRLEWINEVTHHYEEAYRLAQLIPMKELHPDDRLLKMGLLATLAEKSPEKYYEECSRSCVNGEKRQTAVVKLIRQKRSPELFSRYIKNLRAEPNVMAEIALEIYGETHSDSFIRSLIENEKELENTPAGLVMSRLVFMTDFDKLTQSASPINFKKGRDSDLAKKLKARLLLNKKIEDQANKGLKTQDWMLQVYVLDGLAQEYTDLGDTMGSLPVPSDLDKGAREKFIQTTREQARKFYFQSHEASEKWAELWKNSRALDLIVTDFLHSQEPKRSVLKGELVTLSRVAPDKQKDEIAKVDTL